MVVHYSLPQQKITVTHGGSHELQSETLTTDVFLRENAVSRAQIIANDYQGVTFLQRADIGDNLKIEFRFKDETDIWTQVFGGWIDDLQPGLSLDPGEVVTVKALGYGVALKNMLVRQEYGNQSENSTLNTIKEVLTDATHGIIPKYVNKVMASATDSGYSIDTTKVADLTSDFNYLYFPGKPAFKCLEDMVDLIRAANVPNAGAHWTVVPSGTTAYLCLATVGNHENPPADVWPTWWNTDQANSTIEVAKDMIVSAFQKKRSEANYVLFAGNFRRPANGDNWTENNAASWDVEGDGSVSNENTVVKVGSYSIKGENNSGVVNIFYPSSYDMSLDISKIGTKRTVPRLSFYLRRNSVMTLNATVPTPWIQLGTGDPANNDYFFQYLGDDFPSADKWYHAIFPIGEYYDRDETTEIEWSENNSPDWADIDYIGFSFQNVGGGAIIYIDGLYFQGIVTRAAYDSGLYSSQKCKMMLYRDDVPKDDSLIATDDSGQIGQLLKAELYRAVTEPIIGQIMIPMKQAIKGGQLARIHFGKKSDGTFNIDKNMRIIEVRHSFTEKGALSYLTLTDDVKNSQPIQPTDAYNAIMKAVAPGFQDRVRSSFLIKEVDLDQTILAKSYST